MHIRLRDVSDILYSDSTKYYLDPYNYKIHWELYVKTLPNEVQRRLIPIPSLYKEKLIDIAASFLEVSSVKYPSLSNIKRDFEYEELKYRVLRYVDQYQIWDDWKTHAKKYLIQELKAWCTKNNISYIM